jgi:hypothetical protein
VTLRRARRHLLPGAALAGLGLLFVVPRAQADAAAWAGSHMTTPSSTTAASFTITAEWHHAGTIEVGTWVTPPASSSSQCPAASEAPLDTNPSHANGSSITTSSADVPAPCNGTYTFRAVGTYTPFIGRPDTYPLSGSIDVAVPPDNVKGVDATVSDSGDSIAVTWSADPSPAADFLGYRVQRKDASGSYVTIATLTADDTSYTDTSPPGPGKDASYRVLGRRSGPNGREVTSIGGGTASVSVPDTTTTTIPGGTDGDPTTTTVPGTTPGGTAGTTGGAGGTTAGTTGGKTITKTGPLNIGNTGIGTKAPSLGTGTPTDFPALTDGGAASDPGFDTKITYPTDGLASEGGSSGGDGLSSAFYEQGSGRGMAVPVATGFVLFAWAIHLRFLARASRPAHVTPRRTRF